MRYAILGDIHANLAALEAVLEIVDAEGIRTIAQVGDVVGYGAAPAEVIQVLRDLRASGVDLVTVGQYLRPTMKHLPVERFVAPEEFTRIRDAGNELGFSHIESGPFVRSSYHAGEQAHAARTV